MRVLGIQIAYGFSSEVQVFTRMLGNRAGRYDATVIAHEWNGDRETARRIEEGAGASVHRMDLGWRPNRGERRPTTDKMLSWARLGLALPAVIAKVRQLGPDVIY